MQILALKVGQVQIFYCFFYPPRAYIFLNVMFEFFKRKVTLKAVFQTYKKRENIQKMMNQSVTSQIYYIFYYCTEVICNLGDVQGRQWKSSTIHKALCRIFQLFVGTPFPKGQMTYLDDISTIQKIILSSTIQQSSTYTVLQQYMVI